MIRRFIVCILLLPILAAAQEPIYMEAATQPAVGLGYLRAQLLYRELGRGNGRPATDEWRLKARYTHGILYNVSLNAETAYVHWKQSAHGLDDVRMFAKWRVLQKDLGSVDTLRGSLIGGVELPSGTDKISSDSTDPFFGGVLTTILGRHGLNAGAVWQVNTGSGTDGNDQISCDASWLYRLFPVHWQADTKASFYTVLELNGRAWDSGDSELLLAPGLLYEAQTWAAEIALQLPLIEDISLHQPKNFGLVLGFRRLF